MENGKEFTRSSVALLFSNSNNRRLMYDHWFPFLQKWPFSIEGSLVKKELGTRAWLAPNTKTGQIGRIDASMLSLHQFNQKPDLDLDFLLFINESRVHGTTKPWQLFFNNGHLAQISQTFFNKLFFSQINKIPDMDQGVWFNIKYWWKKLISDILKSILRPLETKRILGLATTKNRKLNILCFFGCCWFDFPRMNKSHNGERSNNFKNILKH